MMEMNYLDRMAAGARHIAGKHGRAGENAQ